MHMADALLSPAVSGGMYLCSAGVMAYSIGKLRREDCSRRIPVMGVMGSFVFAAQMVNFTIPGTGSSGHLSGAMLLSAVLGPQMAFLTMSAVLLIQCLLFADGGLMALGANIWNMAFYGCFVGGYVIWRLMTRGGINRRRIFLSSLLGSVLSISMGAFSVVLETTASGITSLPFAAFCGVMLPIHLLIAVVEGVVTAAVLSFLYEARPSLLQGNENAASERLSLPMVSAVILAASMVTGGLLSLLASSYPDGLEWSMQAILGSTELESSSALAGIMEGIQSAAAVLPDYSLPGSEGIMGTALSGILGGIAVLLFCLLLSLLFRDRKRARSG